LSGRRTRWVFAWGALLLVGCVADGTDFEALPIVAVDRTDPNGTHVTVPVALSAYDRGPPHRIIRGAHPTTADPGPGGVQAKEFERDPATLEATHLQILFPFITWEGEGREHEFRLFVPVIIPLTFGFQSLAGPAGRAATGTDPLVANPSDIFGVTPATAGPLAGFPLGGYDTVHVDPSDTEETKRDFGLLPLFMGGDWPLTGKYLAIAPFGGTTRGFLGKDEMTWVGFPYPFYLSSRERDFESTHVLWPFVNWVEGGGREGGRVWPFYAHYRRTDLLGREVYDRHWVMWPFVSWAENSAQQGVVDPDTGVFRATPTDELFIFPFYGKIEGPDDKDYTVLWPFFRYEEIPSTNFWELRAPFPFFIMHHGNDPALAREGRTSERFRFDIWPIFGFKERAGYRRYFALWPIYRYEYRNDEVWAEDTKLYFVPFFQYHHHIEIETKDDYQRTRVWPFVHYRRGVKGDIELHVLAPILWDDPNGFERIIYPFLRLYEYKRASWGGTQQRFLMGLASWRHEPPVSGVTDGYSRLSLLFGLLQFRSGGTNHEESDRAGVRFLYLPEISWGGGGT
jgi:hypothetical protein